MTAFSFNLRFLLIKQQYIRYINHSNLYHFLFSSIHIPHQMTLNASTLMSLSTFLDYFLFLWAYFSKRSMGKAILKHAWAGTKLFWRCHCLNSQYFVSCRPKFWLPCLMIRCIFKHECKKVCCRIQSSIKQNYELMYYIPFPLNGVYFSWRYKEFFHVLSYLHFRYWLINIS